MKNKETLNLLIMANSNKRRFDDSYGRCVAAVTSTGEWIRLVADKEGDSIPDSLMKEIKLRTVVKAEIERAPLTYQKENAVLLKFDVIQDNINEYLKNIESVNESGIFGNVSNQLSSAEIKNSKGTLRYIVVDELSTYRNKAENDTCKATFVYKENKYEEMAMTDPNCYAAKGKSRTIGKARIVVSLPNKSPFYKFVAAIHPA